MAFGQAISELQVKIKADSKQLNTAIGKSQTKMKGFGDTMKKHQKAIGMAVVGMATAVAGSMAMSVKAWANAGDEVQKMSLRTKWACESLSELRYVAEISGTELGAFEKGTRKLNKAIVDASDGLATYMRDFEKLGLNAEALKAMKPEEAFWAVAEALAEVDNEVEQSAIALNLFGRTGTQLFPMFAEGADGIKRLREEAHELGIVFDQEAANKAAEFNDNMLRLSKAVDGMKYALAEGLMPVLGPWMESMAYGIKLITKMTQENESLGKITKWLGDVLGFNWREEEEYKNKLVKLDIEYGKAKAGLNNNYAEELESLENLTDEQKEYIEQCKILKAYEEEYAQYLKDRAKYEEDVAEAIRDKTKAQYASVIASLAAVGAYREAWELPSGAPGRLAGMAQAMLETGMYGTPQYRAFLAAAPEFAYQHGGIALKPQLAMLGEKGPELITPMDKLPARGGGDVHVHFHEPVFTENEASGRKYAMIIRKYLRQEERWRYGRAIA